jgi:hypothetical protein
MLYFFFLYFQQLILIPVYNIAYERSTKETCHLNLIHVSFFLLFYFKNKLLK